MAIERYSLKNTNSYVDQKDIKIYSTITPTKIFVVFNVVVFGAASCIHGKLLYLSLFLCIDLYLCCHRRIGNRYINIIIDFF